MKSNKLKYIKKKTKQEALETHGFCQQQQTWYRHKAFLSNSERTKYHHIKMAVLGFENLLRHGLQRAGHKAT